MGKDIFAFMDELPAKLIHMSCGCSRMHMYPFPEINANAWCPNHPCTHTIRVRIPVREGQPAAPPDLSARPTMSRQVGLQVSPSQLAAWKCAADQAGETVSNWSRNVLDDAARKHPSAPIVTEFHRTIVKQSDQINIRATPEQYNTWFHTAEKTGLRFASWIRSTLDMASQITSKG